MNEPLIKGFVVAVMALAINACALPLASFSLFTTQEGTSVFSIDYLIAAGIQVAPNIIILQLMIALRKNKQSLILGGWIVTMIEILLFFLMYQAELNLELFMYSGMVIVAIASVLLIKTIRSKS